MKTLIIIYGVDSIQLDPERLALVLRKALVLKNVYRPQLEKLQVFLKQMD